MEKNILDSNNYLKAHGIDHKVGDLLYKPLLNDNYIVVYPIYNNIDVFLCKCLPISHEYITSDCVIEKIFSFDDAKSEMVTKFKQMIKSE